MSEKPVFSESSIWAASKRLSRFALAGMRFEPTEDEEEAERLIAIEVAREMEMAVKRSQEDIASIAEEWANSYLRTYKKTHDLSEYVASNAFHEFADEIRNRS